MSIYRWLRRMFRIERRWHYLSVQSLSYWLRVDHQRKMEGKDLE